LLTLPGAALWSVPIGMLGMEWIKQYLPGLTLPQLKFEFIRPVLILLLPTSTVCSFIAMEIFADSKANHGTSTLLMLFNLVTAILSFVTTFAVLLSFFG